MLVDAAVQYHQDSHRLNQNIFNGYNVIKLVLRYDKSGRSTGEAVVAFDKSDDADRAIEEFDGKTAKGWLQWLTICSSLMYSFRSRDQSRAIRLLYSQSTTKTATRGLWQ